MPESHELLREKMLQDQLIRRGIREERLLNAFRKVPRHLFLPPRLQVHAYEDHPLDIGFDQTISQPYIVALMIQCLQLKGSERVLEVGTGSGYQTALLAELASSIFTIERLAPLAEQARKRLAGLGYPNLFFKVGDGSVGWAEESPFDGILVSCATSEAPPPLLDQLKEECPLVIPLGGALQQTLTVLRKRDREILSQKICPCVFVPLVKGEGR